MSQDFNETFANLIRETAKAEPFIKVVGEGILTSIRLQKFAVQETLFLTVAVFRVETVALPGLMRSPISTM